MKKSSYSDEQIVGFLREAEKSELTKASVLPLKRL